VRAQDVIGMVPPALLRRIGEAQHRHPRLLRVGQWATGRWLTGDRVIARGAGRGLRFNAQGGIAGYAVGVAEPEVQEALQRLVRPGDVVYDVGASIGFITVICARLVGPAGRVVAFEPSRRALERLRRNVALNDFANVTVVDAAVGDRVGELRMHDTAGLVWGSVAEDGGVAVRSTTLDAEIAGGLVPPRVVKIDIEGFEVHALAGMARTLADHRPVVLCETHGTGEEVRAVLAGHGYDVRALGDHDAGAHIGYLLAT